MDFRLLETGVKFDFPFEEAIRSILPLCDKVIVAVGNSDDDTDKRVRSIDPKIEVLNTIWYTSGLTPFFLAQRYIYIATLYSVL